MGDIPITYLPVRLLVYRLIYLPIHTCFNLSKHTYSWYHSIPEHWQGINNSVNSGSYLTEIAISAIIVISGLAREEDRLTLFSFPPRLCEAKGNTVYSKVIPECVLGALLTAMLVIIGWVAHKVNSALYMIKLESKISFQLTHHLYVAESGTKSWSKDKLHLCLLCDLPFTS